MKKLFFSLILLIGIISNINPVVNFNINVIPAGISTLLLEEVVVIATKLEKPPRISFIAEDIFRKQLYAESGHKYLIRGTDGELKLIESSAGALGIAQFLPSTWDWLKKVKVLPEDFSIDNEHHQRIAQRLFMKSLGSRNYGIKYDRVRLALAAYNAGSGRVTRLIKKYGVDWEEHLPKETKRYLKIITA